MFKMGPHMVGGASTDLGIVIRGRARVAEHRLAWETLQPGPFVIL